VRRCLAASYAQLLMKQVIRTVVAEVELAPASPRPERPRRSAIAFVPHEHARVVAVARRAQTEAAHV
jgi:cytochrome P450